MARALVLLLLAVVAPSAFAEDAASVVAALKDPAAECRYLATLCTRIREAQREFDESLAATKDALRDGVHSNLAIAQDRQAASEAAFLHLVRTQETHRSAVDVVTAKRGKKPPCAGCDALEGRDAAPTPGRR